jgi:hypothetical protein
MWWCVSVPMRILTHYDDFIDYKRKSRRAMPNKQRVAL